MKFVKHNFKTILFFNLYVRIMLSISKIRTILEMKNNWTFYKIWLVSLIFKVLEYKYGGGLTFEYVLYSLIIWYLKIQLINNITFMFLSVRHYRIQSNKQVSFLGITVHNSIIVFWFFLWKSFTFQWIFSIGKSINDKPLKVIFHKLQMEMFLCFYKPLPSRTIIFFIKLSNH